MAIRHETCDFCHFLCVRLSGHWPPDDDGSDHLPGFGIHRANRETVSLHLFVVSMQGFD